MGIGGMTKNNIMQKGQTVLEVLIALALILLFLSGVVVLELYALRNTDFGQKKSQATRLARQQLERARVIRDSVGLSTLYTFCASSCYINNYLTPIPLVTPTGIYGQMLSISVSDDCPLPEISITPIPVYYRATAKVTWSNGLTEGITPAPEMELSECIADWKE